MKRRGKRLSLIAVVAVASTALFVVWVLYATINETPPYAFMRGARQVGFWTNPIGGVRRSYELDKDAYSVVTLAESELASARGWRENAFIGVSFERGDDEVWLVPTEKDVARTTIYIGGSASWLEQAVGRIYRDAPLWME